MGNSNAVGLRSANSWVRYWLINTWFFFRATTMIQALIKAEGWHTGTKPGRGTGWRLLNAWLGFTLELWGWGWVYQKIYIKLGNFMNVQYITILRRVQQIPEICYTIEVARYNATYTSNCDTECFRYGRRSWPAQFQPDDPIFKVSQICIQLNHCWLNSKNDDLLGFMVSRANLCTLSSHM